MKNHFFGGKQGIWPWEVKSSPGLFQPFSGSGIPTNLRTFATMRTSKPKLCQKTHPRLWLQDLPLGSIQPLSQDAIYRLGGESSAWSAVSKVQPQGRTEKKRLQKKTHIRGCCKIQKTTEGWPKKNIKIKTFMKNPMFQVIQSDLLDTKVGGHQQPLVKGHESPSQKGHPGIARFYKGCLGAGFARHLIATSFHRTLVCKRARCWATQMAEGMKSWHEYWNIR